MKLAPQQKYLFPSTLENIFISLNKYLAYPESKPCIDAKSAEIDELPPAQNKLRHTTYRGLFHAPPEVSLPFFEAAFEVTKGYNPRITLVLRYVR